MTKAIKKQSAYVDQCNAALAHYRNEMEAGNADRYGDLSRLINTALDIVCVQEGKLNAMLAESAN